VSIVDYCVPRWCCNVFVAMEFNAAETVVIGRPSHYVNRRLFRSTAAWKIFIPVGRTGAWILTFVTRPDNEYTFLFITGFHSGWLSGGRPIHNTMSVGYMSPCSWHKTEVIGSENICQHSTNRVQEKPWCTTARKLHFFKADNRYRSPQIISAACLQLL
jgi:hypothetical protein